MSNWKTYGFQNETKNWLNAVAITGSNVSYDTAQIVNGFVESCKNSGIWDNLVDVGIFVGNDLNAALTKLKWHPVAGPYLTNVTGAFSSANYQERGPAGGLSGNGAQYLDSRVPLGVMTPNPHMSCYMTNLGYTGLVSKGLLGTERSVNTDSMILGYLNGGSAYQFRYGSGNIQAASVLPPTPGFILGNYNSSLGRDEIYVSGSLRGTTLVDAVARSYAGSNIVIMTINSAGVVTSSSVTPAICTFYSIGTSLTPIQQTGFYQIVQGLQTALGRQVN